MRRALVLLALLVPACAPAAPAPLPAPAAPTDPLRRCGISADSECAQKVEAGLLAESGGRVARRDSALVLRTGADSVVLTNRSQEGDAHVRYLYAGFLPGIRQHVVDVGYYQGGSTLLVDASSGQRTFTMGRPAVSPDARRFAAGRVDLEAQYAYSGVEIWWMGEKGPVLEWRLEGGDAWGAGDPVWTGPRTMEFLRFERDAAASTRAVARMRATVGDHALTVVRAGPPPPERTGP